MRLDSSCGIRVWSQLPWKRANELRRGYLFQLTRLIGKRLMRQGWIPEEALVARAQISMSEQRHESSKKINWGIVGFMAGTFPSALAIFFVFIPAIRSAGWVIAAVVIGFFCMAVSLILSIVAHA